MLNRRMLRVKAFKVLYSYAENRDMTLKDALAALDASCEATRDLSVYLLSIVIPLTAEAARQAEALRLKFNPTEEELHPNLKFVRNGLAPLLESDPDFQKFLERKKYSWDQDDALIHRVLEAVKSRPYYAAYLSDPEVSSLRTSACSRKSSRTSSRTTTLSGTSSRTVPSSGPETSPTPFPVSSGCWTTSTVPAAGNFRPCS